MDIEDEFKPMSKGFWDRIKYEKDLLGRAVYLIHCSLVPKPLPPEKLWPFEDVESKKKSPAQMKAERDDIMRRVRIANKILEEKQKRKKDGGKHNDK